MDTACSHALQSRTTVVSLDRLCAENYRLRLECPELAANILPGQFFMLRCAEGTDPLLGRPFALYDTYLLDGQPAGVDVGFHVIGKMTAHMERLQIGDQLEIWGPLGNGFPHLQTKRLLMVAGGIGYTPFVAVSREALLGKPYGPSPRMKTQADQASLIYGVRTAEFVADMSDLQDLSELQIHICTEDGTAGRSGRVTDLLQEQLQERTEESPVVFTCGPVRMMEAVATLCQQWNVECWASLETPMACGFGACYSCVVPIQLNESAWDYRRSCIDGPVFRADQILWSHL